MPNKDNLRLWVEALRSGRFEQTRGHLEDLNGKCCCLGVACRVAMENGVPLMIDRSGYSIAFDGRTGSLPTVVHRWLGTASDPLLGGITASYHNDERHESFDQIAIAIEQEFDL